MAADATPRHQAVCLTAPTAWGKTELALQIAARVPVEIISMDSAMVFRDMNIGTAKPSREQLAAVPHHLIDICDPTQSYSAGRFVEDVTELVESISERNRLPLIVGGTMMYLRALRSGLAPLPKASAQLRSDLDAQAQKIGWQAMHAQLAKIDAVSAARIAPTDRQRIQRALEVWHASGEPLSALQAKHAGKAPFALRTVALLPEDRAALRDTIEQRFDAMLGAGFVDEVQMLLSRYAPQSDAPAMRCVGYRQIRAALEGHCSMAQARTAAITATRQLAKRQLTWLRSDPGDYSLTGDPKSVQRRALELVAESGPR